MRKYIFLPVILLFLILPLFRSQSQTAYQIQAITSSPVLNTATLALTSDVVTTSDQLSVPSVDLRPGVRHKEVKTLQKLLKSMGYLPENLQLTEIFGPKTKTALIKFQKSQGLPATGVFDQATRLAFENYLGKKMMSKKETVLKVSPSKVEEFFSNLTSQLDTNVSTTCMKVAVEKRENAIVSSWDAYASKIKTAYEARKNELVAAWVMTDSRQRQTAIKNAWNKYREAVKSARAEWSQSRKDAWTQFAQEAKNCKASVVEFQDIDEATIIE